MCDLRLKHGDATNAVELRVGHHALGDAVPSGPRHLCASKVNGWLDRWTFLRHLQVPVESAGKLPTLATESRLQEVSTKADRR